MIFCRRKCAMNIHVTKDAAAWYKKEYDIDTASLRFFVRYGGFGGNVPGFSLGVHLEEPLNTHTSIKVNDILFSLLNQMFGILKTRIYTFLMTKKIMNRISHINKRFAVFYSLKRRNCSTFSSCFNISFCFSPNTSK